MDSRSVGEIENDSSRPVTELALFSASKFIRVESDINTVTGAGLGISFSCYRHHIWCSAREIIGSNAIQSKGKLENPIGLHILLRDVFS